MGLYDQSLNINIQATNSTASLWAGQSSNWATDYTIWWWKIPLHLQNFSWVSLIKPEMSQSETLCWCSMWPRLFFVLCRSGMRLGHWRRATVTWHSAAESQGQRWKRQAYKREKQQGARINGGAGWRQTERQRYGLTNICWWSATQSFNQECSAFWRQTKDTTMQIQLKRSMNT